MNDIVQMPAGDEREQLAPEDQAAVGRVVVGDEDDGVLGGRVTGLGDDLSPSLPPTGGRPEGSQTSGAA